MINDLPCVLHISYVEVCHGLKHIVSGDAGLNWEEPAKSNARFKNVTRVYVIAVNVLIPHFNSTLFGTIIHSFIHYVCCHPLLLFFPCLKTTDVV